MGGLFAISSRVIDAVLPGNRARGLELNLIRSPMWAIRHKTTPPPEVVLVSRPRHGTEYVGHSHNA